MKYLSLNKKITYTDDNGYEIERLGWNRAHDFKPNAIIYCEDTKDVVDVINYVRENNLDFRVRSGRHHYEGYSSGDNVCIIDISRMKEIFIDEENMEVTIGAGIVNKEAYDALNSLGYPFPGGGCPTVGVGGFVLGGGWGYSARMFGLGCDNVLEFEIVTSNGKILICNDINNSDLFWALKGAGGGNFGVVTKIKLMLPEKNNNATLILYKYPNIDLKDGVKVISTLQEEFKTLDNRLNIKTAIYNSKINGTGVYMTGLFYGGKSEAKQILKNFEGLSDLEELKLTEMSIWDVNTYIQDSHPDFEKYKSGGRFATRDFTNDEIERFFIAIQNRPKGSVYTAVSLYGLGGKISKVSKEDTAFYYREAKFILAVQSVWEEDMYADENRNFVVELYRSYKSITDGSYISFPMKELLDYEKEFYSYHIDKLRAVKRKYDSINLFNFPQSIKLI